MKKVIRVMRNTKAVIALTMMLAITILITMLPAEITAHYNAPYLDIYIADETPDTESYEADESYNESYDVSDEEDYNDNQYSSEHGEYDDYDEYDVDEYDDYDEYIDELDELDTYDEDELVGINPLTFTHIVFDVYNISATPRHRLYTQGHNVYREPIIYEYQVTNPRNTALRFYHGNCIVYRHPNPHTGVYANHHSWMITSPTASTITGEGMETEFFTGEWPIIDGVLGPEGFYELRIMGHLSNGAIQHSHINVIMQRTSSFVDIEGNVTSTFANPVQQPDTVIVGRPDGSYAYRRGEADIYGSYRYFWRIVNALTGEVVQSGHSVNGSTNINTQGERGEYLVTHGPRNIDVSEFPPGIFRVEMTVREIVRVGWPSDDIYHTSTGYFEIIRPPTIVKSANRVVTSVNDEITYTIIVNNPNHIDLQGEFTVIDAIDTRFVQFVPGSVIINEDPADAGDYIYDDESDELRVTFDPLPRGDTVITFRVLVLNSALGQLIRNAAVLQTPPGEDDLDSDEVVIPVPNITKTSNRTTSSVGDQITYTITVMNPSPTPIERDFTVIDYMDMNMVRFIPESLFVDGVQLQTAEFTFNEESGVLSILFNPLPNGNTVITYRVEVLPAAAGQIVRNVVVLDVPGGGDSPGGDEDVPVDAMPPTIVKSANRTVTSVRDQIIYTIIVNNPNQVDLNDYFTVVDELDIRFVRFMGTLAVNGVPTNDFTYNAATGELRVTFNPLLQGNTVITFRVEVLAAATGQIIRNTAVLETPGDDDDPVSGEVVIPVPQISKTSNSTVAYVGDEITYTITVTNPGMVPIATNFAVRDYMNVSMVRFIPESLTMNGVQLPANAFTFNAANGALRIPINPLLPGNTVITYRVEVLEAALDQIVRNVAILDVPGDGDNPQDEEDIPIVDVYRHIRIYYYIRDLAGNVNRDTVHNPLGRDYYRRINSTFSTSHVLNRNQLPSATFYFHEDWSVIVYGYDDDTYLVDKNLETLHGSFVVPPPSSMMPMAVNQSTIAATSELVGETINLIIVWYYGAGEDGRTPGDNRKRLPATGVESYTETWITFLLITLLVMARIVVILLKDRKKDVFEEKLL